MARRRNYPSNQSNQNLVLNQVLEMNSLLLNRIRLTGSTSHGGERDFNSVFGYLSEVKADDMARQFGRKGIANRIASAYPKAVWNNPPEILDDPDNEDDTNFEESVKLLVKKLSLWNKIQRAEILANIGNYSVLFLGTGDEKSDEELVRANEVLFLTPYSEQGASIQEWGEDQTNERFGLPIKYQLDSIEIETGGGRMTQGGRSTSIVAHHSRVFHFTESPIDSDVYGQPIVRSVFDYLLDLEKVVGGAAEIFWVNGRGGFNMSADADALITDGASMEGQMTEYLHGLRRFLKTQGINIQPLQLTVESPRDHFDVLLQLISAGTGIPLRILSGSERGELASSQDERNWTNRVDEKRKNDSEKNLRQIIDKFIEIGVLPQPLNNDYVVKWPDLYVPTDMEKADIATKKAAAISSYANGNSDYVVPPKQFVEDVLGLEYMEEEVEMIEQEDMEQEEKNRQQDQDFAFRMKTPMVPPNGLNSSKVS